MGKQKRFDFGSQEVTVEVEGYTFEFRALTVRELEGLVSKHEKEPEEVLTAAIVLAGSTDGKLDGMTADDFGEWPAHVFRKVQGAVAELNGLGKIPGGN